MERGRRSGTAELLLVLGSAPIWLGGCSLLGPAPDRPAAIPANPPAEAAIPAPAVPAEAIDTLRPSPPPPPRAAAEPQVVPVLVLYAGGNAAQSEVAEQIGQKLPGPGYTVVLTDLDAGTETAAGMRPEIVVAIGPRALEAARHRFAGARIVVSQVLDPDTSGLEGDIFEVAPLPSPALQFEGWSGIDPDLKRIGLITSAEFTESLPAAESAAMTIGAELVHRISNTDKETLYIFRRLAHEIDGLWLAPDDRILSTAVIVEMLDLAAESGIGVLVFSDSLLTRGGLISVNATPGQVAAVIIDLIGEISATPSPDLPKQIPLTEATVRVNAEVARKLGLPANPTSEWIVRDR